jgi:hypothetical protein
LILEGVMTTLPPDGEGGELNVAPMGPVVDPALSQFVFRPFKTSTTYQNLKATGEGVFHVTDDARLIARGAIGKLKAPAPGTHRSDASLATRSAEHVRGLVLADACRWYELRVTRLDDREERTTIEARVVHAGRLRDFLGFNRAKHAVLEAAILATRVHLTGPEHVLAEYQRLQVMIDKTGTDAEPEAMAELRRFVESRRS